MGREVELGNEVVTTQLGMLRVSGFPNSVGRQVTKGGSGHTPHTQHTQIKYFSISVPPVREVTARSTLISSKKQLYHCIP